MRDPSLGFLVFLLPAVAGLPFLIIGLFMFLARPWARVAFAVLLTLALVAFAGMLGDDVALHDTPPSEFVIAFTLGVAVLIFTILPGTRKAFGRPAGRWWLEAALTVVPIVAMFSTSWIRMTTFSRKYDAEIEQQGRDHEELIKLLQMPESSETDARIRQLISARAWAHGAAKGELAPLVLAAKNHPQVFKTLLDAVDSDGRHVDPLVWKYLAETGHYELLPDVPRHGQLEPELRKQLGVDLIRLIRAGRITPGYSDSVWGLLRGGADLTVMDQGRTALDEAMSSGQTNLEDELRKEMNLPSRSQLLEQINPVDVPPRIRQVVDPGLCPKTIVFNAEFTLNRAESVLYRFRDETTVTAPPIQRFEAQVGRNTITLKRMFRDSASGWVEFDMFTANRALMTESKFTLDCS
jgi:hypothetical protein